MNTKNFDQTCRSIDWPSLSKQKQSVLKLRSTVTKKSDKDALDGIIQLIDNLQDAAVDVHGVAESEVFPSLTKVRLVTKAKANKN